MEELKSKRRLLMRQLEVLNERINTLENRYKDIEDREELKSLIASRNKLSVPYYALHNQIINQIETEDMNNEVFNYKGSDITFQTKEGSIMVNATEMAKPFGKRPNDYLGLPTTIQLIEAITRKSGNSENQIVTTKLGSSEFGGGTWLHEDIALDFAQWLSVDFKLWCNDRIKEVLKHGFTATPQKLEDILSNPDLLIGLASELKKERLKTEALNSKLELQLPKVLFSDAVETSKNSCLISELAKIISQKGVNTGQNRLYAWLREKGYLCTKGDYYNTPSQKAMDLGLFEIKKTVIAKPDGSVITNSTPKVTGKGQIYFVSKFLKPKKNYLTNL